MAGGFGGGVEAEAALVAFVEGGRGAGGVGGLRDVGE